MNISSTSSQNSIFGLANQPNKPIRASVRSVDPVTSKSEQEKLANKHTNQVIIADQQAVELFEKNQLQANATKLNSSNGSFSAIDKDKPSPKNETAVASYQAVGNLAQRESVQQLFGVDVFA